MTYADKLRSPKWQRKRLEILERAGWKCQSCGATDKNLQVHHLVYSKRDPWDYADDCYQSLCDECHAIRQELSDKASNALKLALKNVSTERMDKIANELIAAAMNGGIHV